MHTTTLDTQISYAGYYEVMPVNTQQWFGIPRTKEGQAS